MIRAFQVVTVVETSAPAARSPARDRRRGDGLGLALQFLNDGRWAPAQRRRRPLHASRVRVPGDRLPPAPSAAPLREGLEPALLVEHPAADLLDRVLPARRTSRPNAGQAVCGGRSRFASAQRSGPRWPSGCADSLQRDVRPFESLRPGDVETERVRARLVGGNAQLRVRDELDQRRQLENRPAEISTSGAPSSAERLGAALLRFDRRACRSGSISSSIAAAGSRSNSSSTSPGSTSFTEWASSCGPPARGLTVIRGHEGLELLPVLPARYRRECDTAPRRLARAARPSARRSPARPGVRVGAPPHTPRSERRSRCRSGSPVLMSTSTRPPPGLSKMPSSVPA
jgi:hypothetical protein